MRKYRYYLAELVEERTAELKKANEQLQREITERQRAEAELRKYQEHLEELVDARAADLRFANENLQREIAERKRAEEVLRDTSEFLEKIFSTTHLLIAYMDTDFNFIRVNRAYAEADERKPQFFVGKNHFDLYPNKENEAIFRHVVETGEPYSAYARPFKYAEHPERGVTYWDWTLHPIKDAPGRVEGVVLCLVNVTERIEAEEELRKHRDHLEELVAERTAELRRANEQLQREITERKRAEKEIGRLAKFPGENPDPVLRVAKDGTIIYANQASTSLLKAWGGQVNQPLPDYWRAFILDVLSSGSSQDTEVEYEDRVLSLTFAPVVEADYVNVYGLDITDRRRMEETLKESEERFRLAFENANIGVCLVDLNGRLTKVNSQMCEIFGYSREELESMTVNDIAHPEDLDITPEFIHRSVSGEIDYTKFEKRYFHKQGHILWGSISSSLVRDSQGAPLYFIFHVQDITEHKRAVEALQVSHHFLEIVNRHTEMIPLLKEFVAEVKNFTACAAVGLRILDEEGNIPYQAFEGFSRRFYESESPLSIGVDQCMCINVIKGKIDPKLPFYTEGGSFYMNGTTRFLATVSEEEKGRTRNVCNQMGYESVALVPICLGDRILGLIHMADPQENMVPLEMVEVLEGAAMQLGTAIQRVQTEEELRKYRDHLEELVEERTAELTRANEQLQREIAERKRAEEALRESKERFRNLFENAPLCIFDVDLGQTPPIIVRANRQAEKVYGWSAEEFASASMEKIIPSEAIPDLERIVEALRAEETITLESINVRRDESVFPVRVSAASEMVSGPSRIILTIEDITAEENRRSEEKAIAEERRRIAREIHDGLAQDLASMRLKVSMWHNLVDNDPAQMHAELGALRELLSKNIREVRRSIFALRPVALDELGFYPALHQFTNDFGEQNQLHVDLRVSGPEERLPSPLEPVLFRIIQEALNNVGKHAQASTVWVELDLEAAEALTLRVRDDGVGFDPTILDQAVRGGHLGVKQMRERIEGLGGTFLLQSQAGEGTEIQVVLPLSRSQEVNHVTDPTADRRRSSTVSSGPAPDL